MLISFLNLWERWNHIIFLIKFAVKIKVNSFSFEPFYLRIPRIYSSPANIFPPTRQCSLYTMGSTIRNCITCTLNSFNRINNISKGRWSNRIMSLLHFQILSAALFAIGLYGVLARRSAVLILLSIELILNSININLIGFAAFSNFTESQQALGQVIIIFIITVGAAEVGLALAIILRLFKNKGTANIDEINLMKW